MTQLKKLFVLFCAALLFSQGCKEKSTESKPEITKSPKRGVAGNLTSPADLSALSSSLSWWYSWGISTAAPVDYYKNYNMEFIPMLWGGNTSSNDMTAVKAFITSHPEIKYLLVMNEPNLKDQANRLPQQAALDWLKYEQVISDLASQGRTIYLVGPQMNYGTMSGYSDPVTWLDSFYSAYKLANGGRDPKIDYLAFHWYSYGLSSQLDKLKKYGKQIWITEMANWDVKSLEDQKAQMKEMVNICETRSDVFRYAWFISRGNFPDEHFSYLFTQNSGELSELGKLYISLPFNK